VQGFIQTFTTLSIDLVAVIMNEASALPTVAPSAESDKALGLIVRNKQMPYGLKCPSHLQLKMSASTMYPSN
jgi:hypothetical protein